MLEVRACSASYDETPVFDSLSFTVAPGETLAVVGPSGCGKSTLLSVIAGLKPPSGGQSVLNGAQVSAGEASLILQQYGLFPWFTVIENVELGLRIRRIPRSERLARAHAELDNVHLTGLERRFPAALSGGQKQRVAIARALVLDPSVLLMDEPFSSLDALTREKLQDLLLEVLRVRQIPSIIVTHSIEEAAYLGTSIAVMSGRPARLRMIENPGQGAQAYRLDPRFFETCRAVRATLEREVGT